MNTNTKKTQKTNFNKKTTITPLGNVDFHAISTFLIVCVCVCMPFLRK